jgi:hypothetical protein
MECSFIGLRRITREVVPDSIKVDSLAAHDEALGIGTVEGKCHSAGFCTI